jgi:hypothetical protein
MRRRLQIVREPHSRTRSFASIYDGIVAVRTGQMVITAGNEKVRSADSKETITAFFEKRPPDFTRAKVATAWLYFTN